MKKFWEDFKAFAIKGNMVDLAIGVVIGASFNKIIDALVRGLISPPLGYLTGGIDMGDKTWTVFAPKLNDAGEAIEGSGLIIKYGLVLENGIDFFIIAFTIFIVLKIVKRLQDRAEDEKDTSVPTPKNIQLLAEIRDGINAIAKRES
jgi:large conductance mechanosensitive channel